MDVIPLRLSQEIRGCRRVFYDITPCIIRSFQNGFFIEADIVIRDFLFRNQMSCKLLIFEECKRDFQSALKFESHIFCYP